MLEPAGDRALDRSPVREIPVSTTTCHFAYANAMGRDQQVVSIAVDHCFVSGLVPFVLIVYEDTPRLATHVEISCFQQASTL